MVRCLAATCDTRIPGGSPRHGAIQEYHEQPYPHTCFILMVLGRSEFNVVASGACFLNFRVLTWGVQNSPIHNSCKRV